MKNLIVFAAALLLVGCAATSQKTQVQATQNKTWAEMFDSPSWSAINSAKLTENNKVVK
ncbi:hypothetical protein ACWKSR_09120 [Campylobacter fetus subsp. venerealis]